jgi:hypothetical protein
MAKANGNTVKAALKAAFPQTTFSATSHFGGQAILVTYTGSHKPEAVLAACKRFPTVFVMRG